MRASAFRHRRLLAPHPTSLSTTTISSQSPPSTPTGKPQAPRKARQSLRRILHLLSSHPAHSQNPSLSQPLSLPLPILRSYPLHLQPPHLLLLLPIPQIPPQFHTHLLSLQLSDHIPAPIHQPPPPKDSILHQRNEKHDLRFSFQDFLGFFTLVVPNYIEIADFLIRVLLEEVEFDEGAHNFAISVYSESGFREKALLVAERVRKRCEKPSLGFYLAVMEVYRKNRDAKAAMDFFIEIQEREVAANERIYRVLLEILCEVEWVKLCFVVMVEMAKVGFTVDECLGTRLIEKFVEQNMVSEAEYLFREGVIKVFRDGRETKAFGGS